MKTSGSRNTVAIVEPRFNPAKALWFVRNGHFTGLLNPILHVVPDLLIDDHYNVCCN